MTRVLLCDDSTGAQRLVGELARFAAVDGAHEPVVSAHKRTARAAYQAVGKVRADVVLIDLFLPIANEHEQPLPAGPWLARALVRAFEARGGPVPPLVLWTSNPHATLDGRNACRAFVHHGGMQVIDKQASAGTQYALLQQAMRGKAWRPDENDGLTATERRVLATMAAGLSGKQMQAGHFLGRATVDRHITSLRLKLLGPSPDARQPPARGAGPLVAAASAPGSRISWLPVEHLGDPPEPFAAIEG